MTDRALLWTIIIMAGALIFLGNSSDMDSYKGQFRYLNLQARRLEDWQWAQRAGYNWTQSKEGFFSKEVLYQIQNKISFNRDEALVFVGIFCRKEDGMVRTLIRQTSMSLVPPGVVVKFVVCYLKGLELDPLIWAEMQEHHDLYLIDCVENMNEGKSVQYFTNVRKDFPGFSYYSKADTDTYVLFHNLALALDTSPRCLFYGGFCNGDVTRHVYLPNYVSGSFYTISNDLALKLEECGQPCWITIGPEDVTIAEHLWTLVGEKIQYGDFGNNHSLYFDRQGKKAKIEPRHVLLHPLKAPEEWWHVHTTMVNRLAAREVERAQGEYFWDGPHTKIRSSCQ